MLRTVLATAALVAAGLPVLTTSPAVSASVPKATVVNGCIESVPEPGSQEPVEICYSLFKPAGASKQRKVPLVMHSHGWAGSRTTDPASFQKWLDAGYGVLSFDQRGFGQSGGKAHVENPDFEGHDVRRLIALIAGQSWVKKDGPGDPRLGAIGGSYGGGYQFLAAFESLRTTGKPIFDALAPEITWYDLTESLAPELVVRTEWALVLSGGALASQALPEHVYKALVEGAATGMWPDGSVPGGENLVEFFKRNGPKWHVGQGRRLDIPVLLGQGATDTLFNLEQGIANWEKTLTDDARKDSIFVAYNGGHVLPSVFPRGVQVSSDPCSKQLAGGAFADLALRFFDEQLKGRDTGLDGYGRMHFATPDSTCTTVRSAAADATYDVGTIGTTQGVSAPLAFPVAEGPISIAGSPHLTATMTALGVNNRAFFGLAVGSTPADAHLIQNNVLPVNELEPVVGEKRTVTLPSVAVDVPEGQTLYVIVSALSDTFVGMGNRTPGAILLEDTVAHLPVVER